MIIDFFYCIDIMLHFSVEWLVIYAFSHLVKLKSFLNIK